MIARTGTALSLALALALACASAAQAADSAYWTSAADSTIWRTSLDGSGQTVAQGLGGGSVNAPMGTAIDPATNSFYWVNYSSNTIWRTNLDGSGEAMQIDTSGATVNGPLGLAINPGTNSIYWTSYAGHTISRANLDGSGDGSNLSTTGTTIQSPGAIAIDPDTNSIYWTNVSLNTISRANLDGSGDGSNLSTAGAQVANAFAIAVDPTTNSIYWANSMVGDNTISRANLDGSGDGSSLNTAGATVDFPGALALDPETDSIYWTNLGGAAIGRANLDGSGGSDLPTALPIFGTPVGLALLKKPLPVEPPTISGTGHLGEELTCNPATWAPNLPGGFLFRTPRSQAHQWTLDGEDIPDATGSSHVPTAPGSYRCRDTASNFAGSSAQTSEPTTVTGTSAFSAVPASRTFGSRTADTGPSATQPFTVTNAGNVPLDISEVSLQGASADQFTIAQNACTVPLPPTGSCTVDVAFSPTTPGAKSATLRFNHSGPSSPSSVTVTGTGTMPGLPPPGPGPDLNPGGDPGPGGPAPWILPDILPTGALATVASTKVSVRRGRAPVSLRCTGAGACNGAIRIRTAKRVRVGKAKRKRLLVIGHRRYVGLRAGTTAQVRIRLTRHGRRLLKKAGKVRVTIAITPPSAAPLGRATRRGVLYARDSALPSWAASALWPPPFNVPPDRRRLAR